ncbi:glutamate 5-kinase 1 [Clostridium acetireducens DSM 10703]|jgi:glutamate 5-kinase|uniref:Glutamate 5-kinase n=1 Tax=Clostridium acetireducens DSM 10703 TaxID=1121290 RepID=A0A1E8EXF3_9CLOT|nr:glutamate 5-kinase [Clostridium acetireducens]OFI05347.1 glutamate 5-kinase 1 [Clostridium acetireducens DSM 10703]
MENKFIRKNYIKNIKRVVVKIGTSTLTYSNGLLNLNRIELLVRQLSDLHNRGIEIILVSSGAIGAGIGKLGLNSKPKTIPEKQAAAAIGQGILLHMYEKVFSEYSKTIAQILLTREDMMDRTRFLNARNALFTLLDKDIIPIINENDAIVVDEIKFGDNDTLSSLVSSLVEADLLIILSDIDGLYDCDPHTNKSAKLFDLIEKITPEIEKMAGGAGSNLGTGGMATKIKAGKIATSSGTDMVIVNGSRNNILQSVLDGENVGTWFKSKNAPLAAKKRWIAFNSNIKGNLIVDKGACEALCSCQKSLLASGILSIEGTFDKGESVSIKDENNKELARGLVNYNSKELNLIKGLKSCEFESKINHNDYDEVIHKNNLVLMK